MKNHLVQANHGYGRVLFEIEKVAEPIRQRSLPSVQIAGMDGVDWVWISTEIWTFIIDHLTPDVARMAPSLCNGKEMNGLELWRTFFRNNEGVPKRLSR